MVFCPYWANIQRWISTGFSPSAQRNRTTPRCSSMVQSYKGASMFRPRCCHSTEGRALYCTWLNSSTGTVNTAQRASSSVSRLPRNLKIAFTFWFTLVGFNSTSTPCTVSIGQGMGLTRSPSTDKSENGLQVHFPSLSMPVWHVTRGSVPVLCPFWKKLQFFKRCLWNLILYVT